MTLGVVVGLTCLCVYNYLILNDNGDKDYCDALLSIGLGYYQIINLINHFPVAWPSAFKVVFDVADCVTVLGKHFINLKCILLQETSATVFYAKTVGWSLMPIVLVCLCAAVWYAISLCRKVDNVKLKISTSIVGTLYLIYAGLLSAAFTLFSCTSVCNKYYLRADPTEICFEGRHQVYLIVLGLPMLLLYVIGLPLLALYKVKTMRTAHEKATPKHLHRVKSQGRMRPVKRSEMDNHIIYGLLYSSFREELWFWELIVCSRKVLLGGIAVFGSSMGQMQIHACTLVVMFLLLTQVFQQPYDGEMKVTLQRLEVTSLMLIWLT